MNNEKLSKGRKTQAFFVGTSYIILLIMAGAVVRIKGSANIYPTYLINIGVDLLGMLLGYILYVCCLVDIGKTGANHKNLLLLINVSYLGLFTDLVAWVVDSDPDLRIMNIVDNTIYYMCMPIGCYFFFKYVRGLLKAEGKLDEVVDKVLFIGMIMSLLFRVINMFTGMYFTVGADGVYSRGKFYIISTIYLFATTISTIVLIIRKRKQLKTYQIVVLMVYVFAPTAVMVFSIGVYGLSVSYGVIMAVLLLMYCLINIEQSKTKAIADRDLNMAAVIQHSMLPHIFPAFPDREEFSLYASMNPAKEVGGDFYDFFLIDDDHLCMVIADVSGKGVPASLFMMISKTILQSVAILGVSPAQALERTNNAICANNQVEMFVTVWIGVLDIKTGIITASNAGHEYPVIKEKDSDWKLLKDKHGIAVGAIEGAKYKEYEIKMEPGSKLFVYTDGVPEATNEEKNMFGTANMVDALNANEDKTPEEILQGVKEAVDAFVKSAPQFDDLTMLCLEYKGASDVQ
jgi:serine phosphatase RsbU (regulator of sigma subunit)